jgi:putative ABC transport system permease protein
MFDLGVWQEILSTIRKNKLRTFLTSFSVFWGIFILMILLGSGKGLERGVMHNFSYLTNSAWVKGGRTSLDNAGLNKDRTITLKNEDLELLKNSYSQLDNVSGKMGMWGGQYSSSYKNEYGDFDIQGIHQGHQVTKNISLVSGRLLNLIDIDKYRKVAIIGSPVQERLFKKEDPIGKYINISGIPFLVVGVFSDIQPYETERIYVPISVLQKTFKPGTGVETITFTFGNANIEESKKLINDIKSSLAAKHKFDVNDQRALRSGNALEDYRKNLILFNGINIFVGVIGIFTLIAGLVGVSNIMLIVVKERTKEIGIRKALGATPASIINLIILEALIITSFAGYLGLLLGIGLLELVSNHLPDSQFFRNPGVDFNIAIGAAVMVVIAGVIAGFVPARKAARINPIEALRDE